MKFSQMPYERPDLEAVKGQLTQFTQRLKDAAGYEEARSIFLEKEEADRRCGHHGHPGSDPQHHRHPGRVLRRRDELLRRLLPSTPIT